MDRAGRPMRIAYVTETYPPELNGGGPELRLRTTNGSIHINAI